MKKVKLLDVNINIISANEINNSILSICKGNQKAIIANSNINALNISYVNNKMKYFLNKAYINFIDGDGVNWGLKLTGQTTGPKVTYDWWIWELAKFSEKNGLSWFILGASKSSLDKAIIKLRSIYPKLIIKGYNNGFFKKIGSENNDILKKINSLKPNILITAMGMPTQEFWLLDNWDNLNVNVALTGGAVIDYISGELISTPKFFRKYQLEWFFRFIQKPRYFFKRYIIGNPLFFLRIFKYSLIDKTNKI